MSYIPDRGDIIWLDFGTEIGHEQAGRRPAVVLSPASYNKWRGLVICCPMTTRIKNYPFEVPISGSTPSVVLADQIKNLSWQKRDIKHKGKVTDTELKKIRAKIRVLIEEQNTFVNN